MPDSMTIPRLALGTAVAVLLLTIVGTLAGLPIYPMLETIVQRANWGGEPRRIHRQCSLNGDRFMAVVDGHRGGGNRDAASQLLAREPANARRRAAGGARRDLRADLWARRERGQIPRRRGARKRGWQRSSPDVGDPLRRHCPGARAVCAVGVQSSLVHHENDSMKRVEKSPLTKRGSSRMARCSGIDVFTPSTMNSSSARRPRASASARSFPFTISLAMSES